MEEAEDTAEQRASRLTIAVLRLLVGANQRQFGKVARVSQGRVSRYESGKTRPRQTTRERLRVASGVASTRLEQLESLLRVLLEESDSQRADSSPGPDLRLSAPPLEALAERVRAISAEFEGRLTAAKDGLLAQIQAPPPPTEPIRARETADELWARLAPLSSRQRALLIENGREYQDWAVCERLCTESLTGPPQQRVELAELAVLVAEHSPRAGLAKNRLQGYAWGFLGAARQAAGDQEDATLALDRARELWNRGEASPLEPLSEEQWRGLVG